MDTHFTHHRKSAIKSAIRSFDGHVQTCLDAGGLAFQTSHKSNITVFVIIFLFLRMKFIFSTKSFKNHGIIARWIYLDVDYNTEL